LAQPPKANAEQIYLVLKEWEILVRYFKQPGLEDKLRIQLVLMSTHQMLVEALIHLV
jgi:histidinol-phosphate aminotransferase